MNSKEINIWELGTKINIKINPLFLEIINKKIKEQFNTKRNIHKELIKHYKITFLTFKSRLKKGYKYFIDLEILLNICKLLKIPIIKLQQNIIAYKTRGGSNYIEHPKLPIKIMPLFDMLIAHHIGDGNVVNAKGRKLYFSYRQFDTFYRNIYIKKIESIFGKLNYKNKYLNNKNTTRIYFPVVVSNLLFELYKLNINSFKSDTARIPKEILKKNWKHKLAFLIGIIIDEGHIDSNLIVIGLKNELLIKDLQKICIDLNYKSTIKPRTDGMFCLYILSKDLNKFYNDYLCLLEEYPEVNLGYKGEKIKEFINRLNKPKRYIKGNKDKLLIELSKNNLTVNELSKILYMTRQGVRYLIKELVKENKIEIKSIVKFANYKYGLR
jgi:DNA-binding Xre family transcriptional regulator